MVLTTANRVNDFKAVALLDLCVVELAFGKDFAVAFYRDASSTADAHAVQQRAYG